MSERGGEAKGRRTKKDEIEDARDRAIDIVNGREGFRDLESKIAEEIIVFWICRSYAPFCNQLLIIYRLTL